MAYHKYMLHRLLRRLQWSRKDVTTRCAYENEQREDDEDEVVDVLTAEEIGRLDVESSVVHLLRGLCYLCI